MARQALFKETSVLLKASGFWEQIIGESVEIAINSNVVNRDTRPQLGKA